MKRAGGGGASIWMGLEANQGAGGPASWVEVATQTFSPLSLVNSFKTFDQTLQQSELF